MLVSLLPFVLIFVIMYFLILRPQQKRVKEHAGTGQELAPRRHRGYLGRTGRQGHQGGRRRAVEIEVADGVRVRQVRSMVSGVRAKGEPVKDESRARADDHVQR